MKTKLLPSREERWDKLGELYFDKNTDKYNQVVQLSRIAVYFDKFNDFLKKAPKLYMFVPCDKKGNVLEKPNCYEGWLKGDLPTMELMKLCKQYQQALDRVIFDGFEVVDKYLLTNDICVIAEGIIYNLTRMESLADLSGKVYLNINGIKQAGL